MTTAAPTKQSLASVVRQILSYLGIVMGVLTQSVTTLHLPIAESTAITAAGGILLAVEHFVSNPSTGNALAVVDAAGAEPDVAKVKAIVRAELVRLAGTAPVTTTAPAQGGPSAASVATVTAPAAK